MPRRAVDARFLILSFLLRGAANWGDLLKGTGLSKAALSKNLSILIKEVEVITEKGEGSGLYRLSFKGLVQALASWEMPKPPSTVGKPGETEDSLRERFGQELRKYRRDLDEIRSIVKAQGTRLSYPLFEECDAVETVEGYPPFTIFGYIANTMKHTPPSLPRLSEIRDYVAKRARFLEEEIERLERLERRLGHPLQFTIEAAGKTIVSTPEEEKKKELEVEKKTLESLQIIEDQTWRDDFALRFATFVSEGKRVSSLKLHEFWRSLLEEKRRNFMDIEKQLNTLIDIFQP